MEKYFCAVLLCNINGMVIAMHIYNHYLISPRFDRTQSVRQVFLFIKCDYKYGYFGFFAFHHSAFQAEYSSRTSALYLQMNSVPKRARPNANKPTKIYKFDTFMS